MKNSKPLIQLALIAFASVFTSFGSQAFAQQPDVQAVVVEPVIEADQFRPWIITGHYSLLDLMLPNKIGLAVEHRDSSNTSWAFEFSHGSFSPFFIKDLGSFTEDRFTLSRRLSGANGAGFQFFYGAFYQKFKLAVGGEMLNRISGGYYPYADVVAIDGFGAMVGLGYRWMLGGKYVIAIDGIAWSQPLVTTVKDVKFLEASTNQNDRSDIETGVRLMEYFPRFAVAKLSVGYAF